MDRRIKPWINKKIIEYIGEEEATLVDFVCSKVIDRCLISLDVKLMVIVPGTLTVLLLTECLFILR